MIERRLVDLFRELISLPVAEREGFTRRVSEEVPALGAELRQLMDEFEAASKAARDRESLRDKISKRFGPGTDPHISLSDGDPTGPDFASQVRERLADRESSYGRYYLRGEVARGGQGAILRVWDEDLGRDLAMKVILDQLEPGTNAPSPPTAKSLGRFLEEAQVTGQLSHPGIVPVHELGLDDTGQLYFTMKLVKGQDLSAIFELVREGKGGWTRTRALSVLLKVCEAMAYAHSKGVVHRDLKPANVMVGKFGEVYVMDWGLARVVGRADQKDIRLRPRDETIEMTSERRRRAIETPDSPLITMDGDVIGTPAYMSPEQASGKLDSVGPQTDVYAVGAMLYELLAENMPYAPRGSRSNAYAIWSMVQSGPPTALRQVAKRAPEELIAICERAMAREMAERYHDTSALAEDLSAFLEHRVVSAYETGAWAEARKWVERNRGLAVALFALLILFAVGFITFWYQRGVAEKRLEDIVRLSALQSVEDLYAEADVLWPAVSDRIEAYRTWIEEAQALVDDLPLHIERRRELRALALPRTAAARLIQRQSHPDYPELELLEGEIAFKHRALAQRRDGVAAELPTIVARDYPDDVARITALAWERVSPERDLFGEEPLGLALALLALEHEPDDPDATSTLAWAYFAVGRDDEAVDTGFVASELAPEARRQEFRDLLDRLEVAAEEARESIAESAEDLSELEERFSSLEQRVDEVSDWHFSDGERESRWWNNQLTKLIGALEHLERELLADDAVSPEYGWSIPRRLVFAEELRGRYADRGQYAERWSRDLPAIREVYDRLELDPQLGLVPLGPDPASGLWEFAHLPTGSVPKRAAGGELVLSMENGLVFVLVPGGAFTMGAQRTNPNGSNYDREAQEREKPLNEPRLAPFFLSKFEMTQAQWLRSTGGNPSEWPPDSSVSGGITLLHPVEMVSWNDCTETLRRLGLVLPTEAQWEYAARAMTTTPWWTGELRETLVGAVNLADQAAARSGQVNWPAIEEWPELDDGFFLHAPVSSFRPNPFGLHNVHGNVWEWCRDEHASYENPTRDGDGERRSRGGPEYRSYRGGSFQSGVANARSAFRPGDVPAFRSHALGLRPARAIEK